MIKKNIFGGVHMFKKLKGNKGFTLIELIVVIAILAILALLIVPKMTGFTEKGRIAADDAACKTINTAINALIAGGELSTSSTTANATIAIPNYTATSVFTVTNITQTAADVKSAVEKLIGINYKAQVSGKVGFLVTIDYTNGNVLVATN
jgi:prepilin-type N-terminal cleavage/methylation domain-containing protein